MGLPSSSRDALAWHTAMGITPFWVTSWSSIAPLATSVVGGEAAVWYEVGGWAWVGHCVSHSFKIVGLHEFLGCGGWRWWWAGGRVGTGGWVVATLVGLSDVAVIVLAVAVGGWCWRC